MAAEAIEYDSGVITVPDEQDEMDSGSRNGLKWHLLGRYIMEEPRTEQSPIVVLTWVFDSKEIFRRGYDGVKGSITAQLFNGSVETMIPISIDLTRDVQQVRAHFDVSSTPRTLRLRFEFSVVPYNRPIPEIELDPVFEASANTDAILVVEGKQLHVNKSFLSFHSEFFRALFSPNFAENRMEQIPIEEVTYQRFSEMLKVVYPNPRFPTDRNCYTLLEYAQRFLMPCVTAHVEQHLLTDTAIPNDKVLWLADKFNLGRVINKCISKIDSFAGLEIIKHSPVYEELSETTKAKILDHIRPNVLYQGPYPRPSVFENRLEAQHRREKRVRFNPND